MSKLRPFSWVQSHVVAFTLLILGSVLWPPADGLSQCAPEALFGQAISIGAGNVRIRVEDLNQDGILDLVTAFDKRIGQLRRL